MFINRMEELKTLETVCQSKKGELVLVYGRRRIGKSRLLLESIKNKDAVYFLADASENILDILSQQVKQDFVKFSDWEDFFRFIIASKHKIFIIDEFQYLYQVNKAWPSILQRWWEKIKNTEKKIVLCGSIISTVYKITRGYHSALYGRKTAEIHILPLQFKHIKKFFPSYSIEDVLKAYFILGGIPRYLEEFSADDSIEKNMETKLFERTSFLYNEPLNLLSEEFRDFSSYLAILQAISEGKMKFHEIAQYSRVATNKLPSYLAVLERVEIVKKEIPVTEQKLKSKITRYFVKDNFYHFWLKFIMKNKAQIEQGLKREVMHALKEEINTHYGRVFEHVCREIILEKIKPISRIGRWWHRDKEIDIVAVDERNQKIYFAECKWKEKQDAKEIVRILKKKAEEVRIENKSWKKQYLIFAKSFSERTDEALLFDLKEIGKILER